MAYEDAIPAQPIREAKQSRSRLLMHSVREATLALINEQGVECVTTVKIAERTGISPGSLYRYYPNKQAIFTDIYNTSLAELDKKLETHRLTESGGELEDVLRSTTQITFQFYRDLMSLHGNFYSAYHQQFDFTQRKQPDSAETWGSIGRHWLVDLLRDNKHRLRVDDIEGSADFLFQLATGYCHRLIALEPAKLNDQDVAEQLLDVLLRYLLKDYV